MTKNRDIHVRKNDVAYVIAIDNVFKRDKVCKSCGTTKKLTIHHLKEVSKFPELAYEEDNMVTLCFDCHTNIHKLARKRYIEENRKFRW